MGRDPRTASRGSSFAARVSWAQDRGYWGRLQDLGRIGPRVRLGSGWLLLGPRGGDGSIEAGASNSVWAGRSV